jgi:four helix bundle protein
MKRRLKLMNKVKAYDRPADICSRTFEFAVRIVNLSSYLLGKPGVSRTLANQLLKAGTSIGANIEEAQGGQSRADFISKNAIALKEARETHYWLRLLVASKVVPESRVAELRDEAEQ